MEDELELHDDYAMEEDNIPPASSILKQLTAAWINEKNAPELLKYSGDVVDCMMDQIEQMDENLQNLSRDDFRLVPHQMEVNRIRYILASYHRCRLDKIETFVEYLIKRDKALPIEERVMSSSELAFAEEFMAIRKLHFDNEAIKYMPQGSINEDQCLTEVQPNCSSSVFIDVLKHSSSILVNDRSEEVDLPVGSRHLLPYDDVSDLIKNGAAVLIYF